jgi:tRNA threonylcarbamoyladenosine biosynthesis protein TsaE
LLPVEVIPPLHAPILETRLSRWPEEQACADFAAALARCPALTEAFVELMGPLGAGKTTFVRHLLRALGVSGRIKSPSYAVLEPHQAGDLSISHFDFYRFTDPREWADAGFRDLFAAPGLKLAEWPEHAAGQLPTPDLRLHIDPQPDSTRSVRAEALTARGVALLAC